MRVIILCTLRKEKKGEEETRKLKKKEQKKNKNKGEAEKCTAAATAQIPENGCHTDPNKLKRHQKTGMAHQLLGQNEVREAKAARAEVTPSC